MHQARSAPPHLRCGWPALVLAILCATASAVHADAARVKVAFVGDSTGDGLWGGMTQLASRSACLKTSVELGRYGRNSTGLTRPERFNWATETKRIGDSFRPALFMMSLGLNDRQSVVENGQVTMESSPAYAAKYKERVTAVLTSAAASGASLLWIGLPAMRSPAADKDARAKNTLFSEAIAAFGATNIRYVEPWKLNPDAAEDKFASYGPDHNGRIIQIRATDGEHFTPAGDLLVAAYLLPKMLASLASRGEPVCLKTEGKTEEQTP